MAFKIRPDYKQKLLDAVASGKYKQNHSSLLRAGINGSPYCTHCFLGVFMDVVAKHHGVEDLYFYTEYEEEIPSRKFVAMVMDPSDPKYPYRYQISPAEAWAINPAETTDTIYSLNDDGKTFEELAEIVKNRF